MRELIARTDATRRQHGLSADGGRAKHARFSKTRLEGMLPRWLHVDVAMLAVAVRALALSNLPVQLGDHILRERAEMEVEGAENEDELERSRIVPEHIGDGTPELPAHPRPPALAKETPQSLELVMEAGSIDLDVKLWPPKQPADATDPGEIVGRAIDRCQHRAVIGQDLLARA